MASYGIIKPYTVVGYYDSISIIIVPLCVDLSHTPTKINKHYETVTYSDDKIIVLTCGQNIFKGRFTSRK